MSSCMPIHHIQDKYIDYNIFVINPRTSFCYYLHVCSDSVIPWELCFIQMLRVFFQEIPGASPSVRNRVGFKYVFVFEYQTLVYLYLN